MNKDSDQDQQQKLTDQIADGHAIDWEEYQSINNIDTINKLKAVEAISQAFTKNIINESTAYDEKNSPSLFEWGHLQVIKQIGAGCFGKVYKAYDPILNREVALKLRHADMTSAIGSRQFLEEARRLARVRHPNVIAVHGAAQEDNQVGIWTDLIDGQNLKEYFDDHGVLELGTAYQLIQDIAQALNAVHQANLVHGDVKSSNVMRQNNGVYKLMDFGAGSESLDSASFPGIGTPLLMAPELFDGEPISPRTDQYSLGVMLYQILTGCYPLTAKSTLEVKQLHKKSIIKPIQELRPNLPKELCDLINALLSYKPQNRPTSSQVITLINWIKGAPQRRKKIWAITAIITSLSMGIIISTWGYLNAISAEKKALIASQESHAVSDFLADILKSARPNISGKNTPVIEVLESASNKLETALKDQPLARAQVLHHIGKSYLEMTLPKQAIKLLEQAYQLRTAQLGPDHPVTLQTQASLGETLARLSRFDEAKVLLLTEGINELGNESDLRLNFLSARAIYYNLVGELELSELNSKQALELVDIAANPQQYHERKLKLAIEYNNQQRFSESEPIVRESLSWAESNLPRSGLTLGLRQQLSSLLGQTGRFEESETLVRKNIEVAQQWLGTKDPYLIQSLALLSNILGAQSRLDEALVVNTEALNLSLEVNGEKNWYTIRLMGNQANRLKGLGQPEAAKTMYLETIKIADVALSPKHQFSYLPRKNLTELYLEQQEYDAGIEMAKITIPIIQEVRGDKNPWLLESRYLYGLLLLGKGKTQEAKKELAEILITAREVLGDEHPLTVATAEALNTETLE